jgi:hypothetical protein
MKPGSDHPMIETLGAVIAHSQIVVAHSAMPALHAGPEDLDIAVLDWIAVEGAADITAMISGSNGSPARKGRIGMTHPLN